jgi:hypothetical protein
VLRPKYERSAPCYGQGNISVSAVSMITLYSAAVA